MVKYWQLSRLQSLSAKNQISPFAALLTGMECPAWNRHSFYIVETLLIRLLGMDDTQLRQILGISILIGTGVAKLLSWQQHHRCHFVFFKMYISGTKFEEHCFTISRDILDSVFNYFTCTVNYIITFPICIIQNLDISRTKKDIPQRKAPFSCILKSLLNKQRKQIFRLIL